MKFSERVLSINPSITVSIGALAAQKRAEGQNIYTLNAGEPNMQMPEILNTAAFVAIAAGKTKYPPVAGIPELRKATAEWINEEYGSKFVSKNVAVVTGGKYGIYSLCEALINPGDEVIIISPYWVSYADIPKLFGGVIRTIETEAETGWKLKMNNLENAINDKTKIIMFNNATNPTGALYSQTEIKEILELAQRNNILVISDEVYSSLVYDASEFISLSSFIEYKDNVAIIQSCSKNFAMTGWRIGFVLANEDIINKVVMLQGQTTSGASTVGQWVALETVTNYKIITDLVRNEMQRRRDVFFEIFNRFSRSRIDPVKASLYSFVPINLLTEENISSVEFCAKVLEKSNVALVPGSAFGKEDYVRFSFSEKESEIKTALEILFKFLDKNSQMRN